MTGWAEGYVTEIGYTHGYHAVLSPLSMQQALLSQGIDHRWPQKLRYLELGFGQGISLNIHAAATPGGEFWGCDFNPAQAAYAQVLATASGADVRILDDSFEELAARTDLPTFDVMALHGIWTWVSEANRRLIVEIARRHLAVGGVVYVSYNTLPGWAPFTPLWHLMSLHAELLSAEALAVEARVGVALDFAQSLLDANAGYFRLNQTASDKLKLIKGQHRSYVAHEFFTAHFQPMAFADTARALSDAKLSFAASAALLDHLDAINLTPDQQKLLQGQPHVVLRESVRDYLVNQSFRRDLWVKGPRPMTPAARSELALSQGYALAAVPEVIPLKVRGVVGEVMLREELYKPLIAALAADAYAPKTLAQLCTRLPGLEISRLGEALTVLSGRGYVVPTQPPEAAQAARPACDRLNAYFLEQAMHSGDVQFLASPVAGAGIPVNRIEQMFLQVLRGGRKTPGEWANEVSKVLWDQGQRLAQRGRNLQTVDETRAELTTHAAEFEARRLPMLRALQVA